MSHQLSPDHALWQHYNVVRQDNKMSGTSASRNPVHHKETYARLHAMGRVASRAPSMSSMVVDPRVSAAIKAETACAWQPVVKRGDDGEEGIGLSEL